jgi:hypothetical protein
VQRQRTLSSLLSPLRLRTNISLMRTNIFLPIRVGERSRETSIACMQCTMPSTYVCLGAPLIDDLQAHETKGFVSVTQESEMAWVRRDKGACPIDLYCVAVGCY